MKSNPFSLDGKTIVVTGASSGIGQQCAITCSQMGAKVVLLARNEQRLAETLSQMDGKGHLSVSFNLTDFDRLKTKVKEIVSESPWYARSVKVFNRKGKPAERIKKSFKNS